ncbi:unnamed protein product [Mytilus edulis]|uniref:Farnesoic acid O-methyl transferase domain-containing protein n=1 Tax=Mytilus edulis TaxID=6550 RepID=A0A8S3UTR6_MYTED|nr:unnamed protein product [Mytilus edulis]
MRIFVLFVFETYLNFAVPIQITTVDISDDNKFLADYGAFPSIESNLNFEVKGCKDAHIILTSQLNKIAPFYHIGIGLFTNTKTILARERINYEYVDEHEETILDCNNFVQFWLSWENGQIRLGKGLVGSLSTPAEQPAYFIAKSFNEMHTCPTFQPISTTQLDGMMLCAGPTVPSIHAVVAGMFIEKENCPTFSLIDVLTGQQIISCAQCCIIARPECAAFRFSNDVCELVSAVAKSYNTATYFKMN